MKRRRPKHYTVLIARTGKTPITFAFQPLVVLMVAVLSISLPAFGIARFVHSYVEENTQLIEENSQLTEEAANILERVEQLEGAIKILQERAGMANTEPSSQELPSSSSQGGTDMAVEAEILLEVAKARLPGLFQDLQGEVQPALEETLDREAARPNGVPLKIRTAVSSKFGMRRNPFGRGYEFHNGLDFRGAHGTPIHVTAPGVVLKAEWSGGYGYHVIVDHGYGYKTLYAHMSRMAVTQGMLVERDRVVGYLGNTGRSSGPHLHYGVYRSGSAVNPQQYLD